MKKVMIVGGGYYQLPLIKKCNELGYFSIVCGIAGNYPGYKYASKWIDIDTFDKDAVLLAAKNEKIDGILLCGSDACMPTIGYVCDNLNLLGPSEQATINASNKAVMKNCFVKNGVRTAKFRKICSLQEADKFAKDYNYYVVLKVVDASGSRGVAIIKSKEGLYEQFPKVFRETKKDYLVIEEYISGVEFGAQAFVSEGKLTFVMPHGDIVYHSESDVPIGHYAPYEKEPELIADITEQLERCVKALGINNTAINADFILHEGKVYVLEIGARAGATCLPELVSCYFNIDYYEYLIRKCIGENIEFKSTDKTAAIVETLISEKTGIVKSIEVEDMPNEVVSLEIYPKRGDKVSVFKTAYDRIGSIVLKGKTVEELRAILDNLKRDKIKLLIG